jgi:BlaI family transcriptional regulator, penicillinase repressor
VMKVIWAQSPITANQVFEGLKGLKKWKPNTVKTLISRLVQKKILAFYKEGREYFYYSLVSEEECVRDENKSFLNKIYGGTFSAMLVQFLKDEKLSPEEIKELKTILDEKMK